MKKLDLSVPVDGSCAMLSVFLWNDEKTHPMLVLCTGGAYKMLSDQENQPMIAAFAAMGFHVASLAYSLTPIHYPTQLCELAASVAMLREHAEEWKIDSDKILVAGFSAGGHLAASLGVNWHRAWLSELVKKPAELLKPNGMLLGYPVLAAQGAYHRGSFKNLLGEDWESRIDEVSLDRLVTEYTPPCFLWHTGGDQAVPLEGTLAFATELQKCGVSYELHIYEQGRHSLALATALTDIGKDGYQNACAAQWTKQFRSWVHTLTDGAI